MAGAEAKTRDLELINVFLPRHKQLATGRKQAELKAFKHHDTVANLGVKKDGTFSVFREKDAEDAARVVGIMMAAATTGDFIEMCSEFRELLNPSMYIYCVSVAASHRKDVHSTKIPPIFQTHPRDFIKKSALSEARDAAVRGVAAPAAVRAVPVLEGERRLDYYREDLLLNSHHWHWHVVYPFTSIPGITLDRRGELFYYMHKQMVARYDAERISNGLPSVVAFDQPLWAKPIPEGYDPDLSTETGDYAVRADCMTLQDRHQASLNLLLAGIDYDQHGSDVDALGTAIEVGIHNSGHVYISQLRDDNSSDTPGGVMGYTTTAVRDVIFFRWHKYIDDLFKPYIQSLTPYRDNDLVWSGVKVEGVVLVNEIGQPTTTLRTFMREQTFDVAYGLDFGELPEGTEEMPVTVRHIDHDKFGYRVKVSNKTSRDQKATVRIFLVPQRDECGRLNTLDRFNARCIEMDRFFEDIPAGGCTIERSSSASSVVVPWNQFIRVLQESAGLDLPRGADDFCGCGWPEHMQLPRGTADGMDFDVIVMVTDWEQDKVTDMDRGQARCKNASSYCGLRDQKYPDKRKMGFPFDRPMKVESMKAFAGDKKNINYTSVKILDTGRVVCG